MLTMDLSDPRKDELRLRLRLNETENNAAKSCVSELKTINHVSPMGVVT